MGHGNKASARDIILIGGSAGAIESLQQILKGMPENFPASLLVVVHTTAEGPGLLPRVLGRAAGLPAVHPADGESIRPGRIYVAPPDHHLVLGAGDVIYVRRGPRENGHRPAIDPMFRTAASQGYGPRSIAVVLSGYLDDGSAGLYAVRKRGGLGIIQDPADALVEDMPLHALQYAGADYVLPASEIGAKLSELTGRVGKVIPMHEKSRRIRKAKVQTPKGSGNEMSANAFTAYPGEGNGVPSPFSCPECHGVLWEIKEGGSVRYRCRTGHAYSEATLNEELSHAAESALWAAMRALEEKASMARRMADATAGPPQWRTRLKEQAQTFAGHAEMVRKLIFGEPISGEEAAGAQEVAESGQPEQTG